MKKKNLIAIIVAVLMVGMLAACSNNFAHDESATTPTTIPLETTTDDSVVETDISQGSTPPEATEETNPNTSAEENDSEKMEEIQTEPTIPTVLVEDLLNSEDTTLVRDLSAPECEELLWELGFGELHLSYEIFEDGTPVCKPLSLEYNDQAFCLRFSHYDYNLNQEGNGWVMYGLKTDTFVNIAPVVPEDYEYFVLDTSRADTANTPEAQHCFGNQYPRLEDWICTSPSTNKAMYYARDYYPYSGNLYVYYRESSENTASYNAPEIMFDWREYLRTQWVKTPGLHTWRMTNHQIHGRNDYFYENGMTMKDWAESIYNVDGWVYAEGDNSRWLVNQKEGCYIWIPNYSTGEMWLLGHGRDDIDNTTLNDYDTISLEQAIREGYIPIEENE